MTLSSFRRAVLAIALLLLGAVPAVAEPGPLEASPASVVLGRTDRVQLTFAVPGDPGRPVRVAVNVGTVGAAERLGSGRYRLEYTPPSTRFPQAALLLAWHDGPGAEVAFFRLPLLGTTRLPVKTEPRTPVSVRVADRLFGPVTTDERGAAIVQLEVPPGVEDAEVLVGEAKSGRRVALEVPPYNRLVAAAIPSEIPLDGDTASRVDVYFERLGGDAIEPHDVSATASSGTLALLDSSGERVRYRYTPPRESGPREVKFQVALRGRAASSAEVRAQLRAPALAALQLVLPEAPLRIGGGDTAAISVRALDGRGQPLAGQRVVLHAEGREVGAMTEAGRGEYRWSYAGPDHLPGAGEVELVASAGGVSSRGRLRLVADPAPVRAELHFTPSSLPTPAAPARPAAAAVEIRLFDIAGRPATQGAPRVSAAQGKLEGLRQRSPGIWEARYLPPAAPADTISVSAGARLRSEHPVPFDSAPWRLAIGPTIGFAHSLAAQGGPMVAVNTWRPTTILSLPLGLGVTLGVTGAAHRLTGGGPPVTATALWMPLSLRGGWTFSLPNRLGAQAGLMLSAAVAHLKTDQEPQGEFVLGAGGGLFATGSLEVGPGEAIVDVSGSWLPLVGRDFQTEGGGLQLSAGYRFKLR